MKKNEIDRGILKYTYIRYSPSENSTINTPNSQVFINLPREYSVISLLNSYIDINFDVIRAATGNRYADADSIRLVNLGPIALISIYKLPTGSGKKMEEISHAHIVSLMYKLLKLSRDSDKLSIGLDGDHNRRQRELTSDENIKDKYHVRIYLKAVFGFVEHQETATYGLGYELTLTKNTDNAVLNKDNATNNLKIKLLL